MHIDSRIDGDIRVNRWILLGKRRRKVKMRVCVPSAKFYEIYERAWCMLCEEQLEGGIENLPIIIKSANK